MHEKDKTKAIIQLVNKALSSRDEDHLPALFNQIYRLWDGETNTIEVALQDHDGNVTPFVKITQSDIVITVLINHIVSYQGDEQFPPQHFEALWKIVRLFNDSDDSESQVFAFAAQFYDYFAGPEEARRRYEIDNFPKAEEILPDNGMEFDYEGRIFTATDERLSSYVVAQAPPKLVHLPGEKQDAVFDTIKKVIIAGPFNEGYRAKLFRDENGQPAVRCFHWHNGPSEGYWLLREIVRNGSE